MRRGARTGSLRRGRHGRVRIAAAAAAVTTGRKATGVRAMGETRVHTTAHALRGTWRLGPAVISRARGVD